jgi:hypothetical protein
MSISLPLDLYFWNVKSAESVQAKQNYLLVPAVHQDLVFQEDPRIPSIQTQLRAMNIPGLSIPLWMRISKSRYERTTEYALVANTLPSTDIMKIKVLRNIPPGEGGRSLEMLFIGDYSEIKPYVEEIDNGKINNGQVLINWKALCPDPYGSITNQEAFRQFNPANPNESNGNLSDAIYEFYDKKLNRHWNVGIDGSGLLTIENLLGLAPNTAMAVICDFKRLNTTIFDHNLLMRFIVASLRSCQQGGVVLLKYSIPHTTALRSMLAFFDMFFRKTEVFTLKQYSPDDSTIYVMGIGYNSALFTDQYYQNLLIKIKESGNHLDLPTMARFLEVLMGSDVDPIPQIQGVYGTRISEQLTTAAEVWMRRN